MFSAGNRTVRYAEDSTAKFLDLFKRSDKVDDYSSTRPSGLTERQDLSVNNFRRTTSMSVIVAWISSLSESQRRKGLVRNFLSLGSRYLSSVNLMIFLMPLAWSAFLNWLHIEALTKVMMMGSKERK